MTEMARGTVRRGAWLVAGLVGLLVSASPARAGYVTAEFLGVGPGLNVGYTLNGVHSNTSAGQFQWKTIASDAGFSGQFHTFCIDLTQSISMGNTYTYNLVNIDLAPDPGTGTGGSGVDGPMGLNKAQQLRELWNKFHPLIGNDNLKSAAFQIAVWDIVYDDFTADAGAAATLANTWLISLNGLHDKNECALIALSDPRLQDQVTCHDPHETPVPPTLALAGIGILSLFGYSRPWRRRS